MRYTWKREPNEKGLARVCQAERGYDLRLDGNHLIAVRPNRLGIRWYWYGLAHNTLDREFGPKTWRLVEDAKADALKFAKEATYAK